MNLDGPIAELPEASVRTVAILPDAIEGAIPVGPYSQARPGMLLRVVPGVGKFLARDGTAIEVCVEPGADPAAVDALIHGGVLGALIHQRGDLPLHASTLVSPDRTRALAIAGDSGAGKSTLAYELIRRGWAILSDDLTRVTIEEGNAMAWPGRTRLRLMSDACALFGIDTAPLQPVPGWPGKFYVPTGRWESRARLTAMVALQRTPGALGSSPLAGLAAISMLTAQTFRIHYVAALGRTEAHLRLIASMLSSTRLHSVSGSDGVSAVADLLEDLALRD